MKKIYTISFAIVCAVTVFAVNGQYDVLPKTITPANNTPRYSIFDEEGKTSVRYTLYPCQAMD